MANYTENLPGPEHELLGGRREIPYIIHDVKAFINNRVISAFLVVWTCVKTLDARTLDLNRRLTELERAHELNRRIRFLEQECSYFRNAMDPGPPVDPPPPPCLTPSVAMTAMSSTPMPPGGPPDP